MLADRYETYLLDLDGVVLLGDSAIPGAAAAIRKLRARGKRVRFVTNNSRSNRETLARTLRDCGIGADPEAVVSSGWATADYVAECGFESVFVVGTPEVKAMVRERGVDVRDADAPDVDAEAVVVGHDEGVTYADIERATRLIYDDDTAFVAANTDGRFPTDGGIAPGTGAIVAAIETATEATPTVVGKPEPRLFEHGLDGTDPDDALMVGDNPRADVAGATRAGIDAVLVTDEADGGADRHASDGADHDSGDSDGRLADVQRPMTTVRDLTGLFDGDPRDDASGGGTDR